MSISSEITSMGENLKKDYQSIANLGADLTNVDKNIENIAELLDGVYDVLPKTSFQTGTEVTLENCLKGKLDYENGVVGIGDTEQAILPSEYQQVEYIESSGTQYIDTGVKGNNQYRIDTTFKTKTVGISQAVYGYYAGAENKSLYLYCSSGRQFQVGYGTWRNIDVLWQDNKLYDISLSNGKIVINGTEETLETASDFTTDYNLTIFRLSENPVGGMPMQLYKFKIYDNNVLVRDFIPCYRISDNEIGLYDIVNNVFYTNQGSGTFTKGANAPTPNAEIPIKCVTGNIEEVVGGKNELEITATNQTKNNVEFTINSDKSIKANGTANGSSGLVIGQVQLTANETYTLSGCASNGGSGKYTLSINEEDSTTRLVDDTGSGATYTPTTNGTYDIRLNYWYGFNIQNLVFYPMLRKSSITDDTYEPYITPTSYQLSLGDIELNAIGDYKDELIYDVDEDKVYKKAYIGKLQMTKDLPWNASMYDTAYQYFIRTYNLDNFLLEKHQKYCNYFEYNGTDYKTAPIPSLTENDSTYVASNFMLVFKTDGTQGTTLNEWKSWLDNHTMWVLYRLTTPTLTELTDETLHAQVKALYNAHSLNGTTIITSNGNLPMIIKVRGLKGE